MYNLHSFGVKLRHLVYNLLRFGVKLDLATRNYHSHRCIPKLQKYPYFVRYGAFLVWDRSHISNKHPSYFNGALKMVQCWRLFRVKGVVLEMFQFDKIFCSEEDIFII